MNQEITLGEALAAFRCANAIQRDDARSWTCKIGPLTLRLPNFRWRRRAILRHDLHHVLTGYPCTLRGEFQMAAWEFAAGRFPHSAATLFCLPLVAAGVLWSPRAMWQAFTSGRRGKSLYAIADTQALLATPLQRVGLSEVNAATGADAFAFAWLIVQSCLLVLLPVLPLAAWLLQA